MIYSYLLFPILFFLKLNKFKGQSTFTVICIYSFIFFSSVQWQDWILDSVLKKKVYYALYTFLEYVLEYVFFALIIYLNIRNKKYKRIIIILSFGFIAFQLFYFFTTVTKRSLDTIPVGIESILTLTFSFYFFYEQLKESVTPIYDHYFFWIAIGMLIYLCGSFFMYILGNDIPRKQLEEFWFITYIFDTVKNFFFVTSGLVFLKQSRTVHKTVLPNLDFY